MKLMAYKNKVRISVPVTKELDERITKLADKFCTTKSNLCAMLVAQQIDAFELSFEILRNPKLHDMIVKEALKNDKEDIKNFDKIIDNISNCNTEK